MYTVNNRSLVSYGLYCNRWSSTPIISSLKLNFGVLNRGISGKPLLLSNSSGRQSVFHVSSHAIVKNERISKTSKASAVSPNVSSPSTNLGLLDAYDDEYGGVIIEPECLPSSANAFASILQSSIFDWTLKGKKGIWLKILTEQADLVPIAIKEGFSYHHAEPGYVVLTYWIPDEPCMLPEGPSHQIGVGAFVINERREVLVVKEKQCPCRCIGLWKLPTDCSVFISHLRATSQSEELFAGAVREVKEETGIESAFAEVIAFRHAHRLAFEKSDLLFLCMLKPLSSDIVIDDKEIQAAKWMPLEEFVAQPFFEEDHMLKMAIDICIATYENAYHGFTANQLISKFDGQLSHLYYNEWMKH
ncbi:Nudix hydrolase [Thalictrum thalictroides]|uniref:Nudix hydrolase n=1 Tax=Thalictrum thalictroides TaxID=46969 RepID=A0A7J6VFC2_THATH|nr:Nudix hydrolase [Thalictrum thalictroides]